MRVVGRLLKCLKREACATFGSDSVTHLAFAPSHLCSRGDPAQLLCHGDLSSHLICCTFGRLGKKKCRGENWVR